MIAFLCNKCKKPINTEEKHCVHLKISYGKDAIVSEGRYGSGWSADLCQDCWEKIAPMIDEYYYGGNKYLKGGCSDEER